MKMFRLDEFGRPVWPTAYFSRPSFSMGQGNFGGSAPSGGSSSNNQSQSSEGNGQVQQQPSGQAQGQPSLSDLGSGFMGRVKPEHQALLAPYIQQWDAGVTRRFQDLHNQYRPYQDLGADPDTLQTALTVYQMLDENPEELVRLVTEQLGQHKGNGTEPQPGAPGSEPQSQQGPGAEFQLPPAIQQKLDALEQIVEKLAEGHIAGQDKQKQDAEDAELDQYLQLLKQEYGEYDEAYVISQMMAGKTGEEAVKAFQTLIQGQVNQRAQPFVPPIMGGGGAVPQQQQTIAKANRPDVQNLVASLMAQAQQA